MQLVTVQFNYDQGPDYKLLFDVFKYSCQKYTPECEFVEYLIDPPKKVPRVPYNFTYNTVKLKIWLDHIKSTDQDVIFADCDMLAIKDFSHAFDDPDFDICYTERTRTTRIPMNGGIVLARPNERTIDFFKQWEAINRRMHNNDMNGNTELHNRYRRKWAGMNQAAFGWMMEHPHKHKARIKTVPTKIWNAVDCDWSSLQNSPDTVFIHIKSGLRKAVLRHRRAKPEHIYARKLWNEMCEEAGLNNKIILEEPKKKKPPTRLTTKRRIIYKV